MSTSRRLLVIGLAVVVVDLLLAAVGLAPPFLLFGGLGLCIASAATFAARTSDHLDAASARRRGQRQVAVAVSVLGLVALAPFVVGGVLWALDTDPMSLFIASLAMFALSAALILVFLVVYFVSRGRARETAAVLGNGG